MGQKYTKKLRLTVLAISIAPDQLTIHLKYKNMALFSRIMKKV
jgi:hypothetical protein